MKTNLRKRITRVYSEMEGSCSLDDLRNRSTKFDNPSAEGWNLMRKANKRIPLYFTGMCASSKVLRLATENHYIPLDFLKDYFAGVIDMEEGCAGLEFFMIQAMDFHKGAFDNEVFEELYKYTDFADSDVMCDWLYYGMLFYGGDRVKNMKSLKDYFVEKAELDPDTFDVKKAFIKPLHNGSFESTEEVVLSEMEVSADYASTDDAFINDVLEIVPEAVEYSYDGDEENNHSIAMKVRNVVADKIVSVIGKKF